MKIIVYIFLILSVYCSYGQYRIKSISNVSSPVYSITAGGGYFLAGTKNGIYIFNDSVNNNPGRSYTDNKFTMVRYADNQFFAGRVDIWPFVGTEYCVLINSAIGASNWKEEYDTKFGNFSRFYLKDVVKHGNALFLSMKGVEGSPGGHIYKFENGLWSFSREGYKDEIPYFEFYDLEIFNGKLYCSVDPTIGTLVDDDKDGSIMELANGNWSGKLSINNIIYSLKSHNGYLYAGGKNSININGVLLRTSGNPQKDGTGWDIMDIPDINQYSSIKALEFADGTLFVGNENGQIFYTENPNAEKNAVQFTQLKSSEVFGNINELLYLKETNKLYIAANGGLFEVDLNAIIQEKFDISGSVYDKETNEKLDSVKVVLDSLGLVIDSLYTDTEGYYIFKDISAGKYTLTYSLSGYKDFIKYIKLNNDTLTLDVELQKKEAIKYTCSGKITDCKSGGALSNTLVFLEENSIRLDSIYTNSMGNFLFTSLDSGSYTIRCKQINYDEFSDIIQIPKDTVKSICMDEILPTEEFVLILSIFDTCNDLPLSNASIRLSSSKGTKDSITNESGEIKYIFNGDPGVLTVITQKENYHSDTTSFKLSLGENLREVGLSRTIIIYTINSEILHSKEEYNANDKMEVHAFITSDCQNQPPREDKFEMYVSFDPKEVFLESHQFDLNSSNVMCKLNSVSDTLKFLILIGERDSTKLKIVGNKIGENPDLANWGRHIWIKKAQPFKIRPKSFGIIQKVNPNPILNKFEIDYSIYNNSECSLFIIDGSGKLMGTLIEKGFLKSGDYKRTYEVNNLSKGLYFIVLQSGEDLTTYSIIVN